MRGKEALSYSQCKGSKACARAYERLVSEFSFFLLTLAKNAQSPSCFCEFTGLREFVIDTFRGRNFAAVK